MFRNKIVGISVDYLIYNVMSSVH